MNTATPRMSRAGETGYRIGNLVADKLPKRQCEILLYTAKGFNDKASAEEMNCAPSTAKHLRKQVHFKLNTHNGPELITKAFELGYLRFMSIALAILLGIGAITTPRPAEASDNTKTKNEEEQMRLRNRQRNRQRSRQRQRTRTNRNRHQVFYIFIPTLSWDEDTQTLLIEELPGTEEKPLTTITEKPLCVNAY